MTTVNSASSAMGANAAAQSSAATNSAEKVSEEYDKFLRLLTAQVQNQDPLSPLDSTQFVEQLATFSSLEQEVRANQNLETIANAIGDLYTLILSQYQYQNMAAAQAAGADTAPTE